MFFLLNEHRVPEEKVFFRFLRVYHDVKHLKLDFCNETKDLRPSNFIIFLYVHRSTLKEKFEWKQIPFENTSTSPRSSQREFLTRKENTRSELILRFPVVTFWHEWPRKLRNLTSRCRSLWESLETNFQTILIARPMKCDTISVEIPLDRELWIRNEMFETNRQKKRSCLNFEFEEFPDKGVQVANLTWHRCTNVVDCEKLMEKGNRSRATGATLMNKDSSRSHSIFTIITEVCEKSQIDGKEHIRAGKLNLVDLAGSERQSKTRSFIDWWNVESISKISHFQKPKANVWEKRRKSICLSALWATLFRLWSMDGRNTFRTETRN